MANKYEFKQDAERLAEIFKSQGIDAATVEFRKIIEDKPYWVMLALKDEVRKLITESKQ